MNSARSRLLGVSLLCGAGAAAVCWHGLAGYRSQAPAGASVPVLVFARPIDAATALSPADVRWAQWPGRAVSGGMVQQQGDGGKLPSVEGVILPAGFSEGDPVPRGLIAAAPFPGLPLQPGMRAIPVRLPDQSAAAMLRPGVRVDLIFTRPLPATPPGDREMGQGIRDVRVLSVQKAAEGSRDRYPLALVELSPEQAETAAPMSAAGHIAIAFAGPGHGEDGGPAAATASTTASPPAPVRGHVITLVKHGMVAQERQAQHFQ